MNYSLGCMISDIEKFRKFLFQSDGFRDPCWNGKLIYYNNPPSAAVGLNGMLKEMEADGVKVAILLHQDAQLPAGWFYRLPILLQRLPPDWFVAGVWGVKEKGKIKKHHGKISEARWGKPFGQYMIMGTQTLPAMVDALDECCLIIRTDRGFRFDESLQGFDLYGSEVCMWAAANGGSAWVIDNYLIHHSDRDWNFAPSPDFMEKKGKLEERYSRTLVSTVL